MTPTLFRIAGLVSAGIVALAIGFMVASPPAESQTPAEGKKSGPVRITLDPKERFQTFDAWETTGQQEPLKADPETAKEFYDLLLGQIGIGRLRVEVIAGAENSRALVQEAAEGKLDTKQFRKLRYQTENDNDDPFVINPAGFHFEGTDRIVENAWLPLKAEADARGLPMEFSLNYVAFTNQSQGGPFIHDQPEEYAEFILATFQHLKDKYGIVPDTFEPVLEPDMSPQFTPEVFAANVLAATKRLTAAGFRPRIILPSTMNASAASKYFDAVRATPGAMELVGELSFHMYKGGKNAALKDIAKRAADNGLNTGMTEFWLGKGTYDVLYRCLAIANVSVWQNRAMLGFFDIDATAPAGERVKPREDVRYNLQYHRAIRHGAVRIGAQSADDKSFDPVAFINTGDKWSVVILARRAGTVEIAGLPAGTYEISEATAAGSKVIAPDAQVKDGEPLEAQVSDKGVLTVRAP